MKILVNDPHTVTKQEVLDWLHTLPPERVFDYLDNDACLFASFAKEALCFGDVRCGGPTVYSTLSRAALLEIPASVRRPITDILPDTTNHAMPFTVAQAIAALEKQEAE